jgi:hypothetical protein
MDVNYQIHLHETNDNLEQDKLQQYIQLKHFRLILVDVLLDKRVENLEIYVDHVVVQMLNVHLIVYLHLFEMVNNEDEYFQIEQHNNISLNHHLLREKNINFHFER